MMQNQTERDVRRAATIKETAEVIGVSTRHVQRVLSGDRENDKVIMVFMELTEKKSELLEEVKKLVPFI